MITFEYLIDFDFKPDMNHKIWINNTIRNEGKIPGEISYLFCNDEFMIENNIKYLNHDTYTDIITFDETFGDIINGSILISIDRVVENSKQFNTTKQNELIRVLIHGALHLCGYKDKTEYESEIMRQKEKIYIEKFNYNK